MTIKNYHQKGDHSQSVKLKTKRYALCTLRNAQWAFTLLELLLVIAIIAVLVGIITFALRPAENIQNATDVQTTSKASDIEKAIQLYALDNNGTLPGNILNKTSISYEEICREDANSTYNCINLNTLKPDYLSEIPIDETRSTDDFSGYILKYNPEGNSIDVMSASEYESKTNEILSEGLVGYWKMDETSWNGTAGEVIDSSGNGNNGRALNGAIVTSGKFGNAAKFPSSGSAYINSPDVIGGQHAYTIALWANKYDFTTGGPEQGLFSAYVGSYVRTNVAGNTAIFVRNSAGIGQFWSPGGSANMVLGWHHYVFTIDSDGTMIFYRDGTKAATTTYTAGNWDYQSSASLGFSKIGNYSTPFYGEIDELRVYNRALSASEVESLYEWAPGPVAHWKFDEGSGNTAFDSSGNGNDGSLVNGPSWVNGKYGNALDFDGVNDYVNAGTGESINITVPITIEAWIQPEGISQYQNIVTDRAASATTQYALRVNYNSTGLSYYFRDNTSWREYVKASVISINEWQHVAITNEGTNIIFYKNGLSVNQFTTPYLPSSSAGNTQISGFNGTSEVFEGKIDDVRIYNYVRTPEQIIEDMNNN